MTPEPFHAPLKISSDRIGFDTQPDMCQTERCCKKTKLLFSSAIVLIITVQARDSCEKIAISRYGIIQ